MIENKKIFNFGILGCGMIAGIHAKALEDLDDACLLGAADHDLSRARAFCAERGIENYESYESMLSDPKIDAVCICTPSGFHAENAIKAMEMGKHVVVEKPIAIDIESADRVVETCERTGKCLTVISQLRFADDIDKVKRLMEENAFGKVSLCSLIMKYYRSPEYYSQSSWKGTRKVDGGGALMNQGIHGVDILLYLMGNVASVNGMVATLCHGIEVEDTAVATLRFESGALGVIEASSCAYPGFDRRIEIHGDRGYVILTEKNIEKLMIDRREIEVPDFSFGGTASDPSRLESELHLRQLRSFIEAIKSGGKISSDCHDGRRAVYLIEKIYTSSV